jgi:hypothetical protein
MRSYFRGLSPHQCSIEYWGLSTQSYVLVHMPTVLPMLSTLEGSNQKRWNILKFYDFIVLICPTLKSICIRMGAYLYDLKKWEYAMCLWDHLVWHSWTSGVPFISISLVIWWHRSLFLSGVLKKVQTYNKIEQIFSATKKILDSAFIITVAICVHHTNHYTFTISNQWINIFCVFGYINTS